MYQGRDNAIAALTYEIYRRKVYDDLEQIADLARAQTMKWEFEAQYHERDIPTFNVDDIKFSGKFGGRIFQQHLIAYEDMEAAVLDLDRDYLFLQGIYEWERGKRPDVNYAALFGQSWREN